MTENEFLFKVYTLFHDLQATDNMNEAEVATYFRDKYGVFHSAKYMATVQMMRKVIHERS